MTIKSAVVCTAWSSASVVAATWERVKDCSVVLSALIILPTELTSTVWGVFQLVLLNWRVAGVTFSLVLLGLMLTVTGLGYSQLKVTV